MALTNWLSSFIQSVVCLMTGSQPLPKWALHTVWSSISSFTFQYPCFSLRSPSSCLCLLSNLLITPNLPSVLSLIMCFTRQFLRKMWPSQLAFLLFIVWRTFLSSLAFCNTSYFSHDQSNWSSQSFSSTTLQNFVQCSSFTTIQSYTLNVAIYRFPP